jgi:hypothetical protein
MWWKKFVVYMPSIPNGIWFTEADVATMNVNTGVFLQQAEEKMTNYEWCMRTKPSFMTFEAYVNHCACCWSIILHYRTANDRIVALWSELEDSFLDILEGNRRQAGIPENVVHTCKVGYELPNNRFIRYEKLQFIVDKGRRIWSRYTREGRRGIHKGLACGNIVQSLSRHIMADQWLRAIDAGLNVVLTCHDEIVLLEKEDKAEEAFKLLSDIMSTGPAWSVGLPLACEGGIADSYGGAK